jgi:hypothetical protein
MEASLKIYALAALMWEVTALSLNMGFSGFLRWFGQFAKRKVT